MESTREQRFEDLMGVVYGPLQRFVRRRTGDGEDVLADVLLVLWRRLDDVPADAALPWSYGVARGCLLNARRSHERRWKLLRRIAAEPAAPEPAEDPDLAVALGALPEADQEVLRLWAWEGLPPREMAVVRGITANAASLRLHRATIRLRTELLGGARKSRPSAGQEPDRQGKEATR